MIVFSCVNVDYFTSVLLPRKNVYFSFIHFPSLDKHLLCMEAYDSIYNKSFNLFRSRRLFVPDLENYKALPYKRQSFIDRVDKKSLTLYSRLPWFDSCSSLSKIRSFYSNCKKYYVVIANRQISGKGEGERVAITFDRYSDAVSVSRDFSRTKIVRLLKDDFKCHNAWYPYLWIEYMNHPISLLGDISTYNSSYQLGSAWCDLFLCFLKDGFVRDVCFNSLFGFIKKDNFSQIVHYK